MGKRLIGSISVSRPQSDHMSCDYRCTRAPAARVMVSSNPTSQWMEESSSVASGRSESCPRTSQSEPCLLISLHTQLTSDPFTSICPFPPQELSATLLSTTRSLRANERHPPRATSTSTQSSPSLLEHPSFPLVPRQTYHCSRMNPPVPSSTRQRRSRSTHSPSCPSLLNGWERPLPGTSTFPKPASEVTTCFTGRRYSNVEARARRTQSMIS